MVYVNQLSFQLRDERQSLLAVLGDVLSICPESFARQLGAGLTEDGARQQIHGEIVVCEIVSLCVFWEEERLEDQAATGVGLHSIIENGKRGQRRLGAEANSPVLCLADLLVRTQSTLFR